MWSVLVLGGISQNPMKVEEKRMDSPSLSNLRCVNLVYISSFFCEAGFVLLVFPNITQNLGGVIIVNLKFTISA